MVGKTIRLNFPGGEDTASQETELPLTGLDVQGRARRIVNFDVANQGRLIRRSGITKLVSATRANSLWSDGNTLYWTDAGTIYSMDPHSPDVTTIETGLNPSLEVSFASPVPGMVFWSNGEVSGTLSGRDTWGVAVPGLPTVTSLTYGGLDAGLYQVAVTWITSTGEQSGAGGTVGISVPAGGGIGISQLEQPTDSRIVASRIWVSPANGDALYWIADLPVGVSSDTIGRGARGSRLEFLFLSPPPPGKIVRSFNGRMWIAAEDAIWYTEALAYGLCRMSTNFLPFAGATMMEPVVDGLYVGMTGGVWFLSGSDPKSMTLRRVSQEAPVPGTGGVVDGRTLGGNSDAAAWLSVSGWQVGFPGGEIKYLTPNLSLPDYDRGSSATLREINGIRQILSFVQGAGQSAAANDFVTTQVIRNGVVVS